MVIVAGWHQMSYYVAEPDQELDQWYWGDVGLGEETVCKGGPMNRGCALIRRCSGAVWADVLLLSVQSPWSWNL